MSLTVPEELVRKAHDGAMTDDEFLSCVQSSLPYAWSVVEGLVKQVQSGSDAVEDGTVPPDDKAWGELLRFAASDSMRGAVERKYGVKVAFQNCCKTGMFTSNAENEYKEFVSPRSQILNQKPELLNC
ncbi:SCO5389 family protein [Amycolatopsis minnesotensis]|uniref:SCO5389 family protein n=1 Tax=Amycolatopsis minnesotensis TaxID=337894 RepID=A0ABN2SW79_9PSEU